jgi:hypothetical protein
VEPELGAGAGRAVAFDPLLRVVTTGVADGAGAVARVPLDRVRVATDAAAPAPAGSAPEGLPPPVPVPATW